MSCQDDKGCAAECCSGCKCAPTDKHIDAIRALTVQIKALRDSLAAQRP